MVTLIITVATTGLRLAGKVSQPVLSSLQPTVNVVIAVTLAINELPVPTNVPAELNHCGVCPVEQVANNLIKVGVLGLPLST